MTHYAAHIDLTRPTFDEAMTIFARNCTAHAIGLVNRSFLTPMSSPMRLGLAKISPSTK